MNNVWLNVIELSKKAAKIGEVPVGAVIVFDNKIIAKAYNTREKTNNIMDHAEIKAINIASKVLGTWKLNNCEIYVNLKPCTMCEAVIKHSRIAKVHYLIDTLSFKKEYYKTIFDENDDIELKNISREIFNDFFNKIRQQNK